MACVAVCATVLQFVAVMLPRCDVCVMMCVAVCIVVCCRVLQHVALMFPRCDFCVVTCVAVYSSVLHYVAVMLPSWDVCVTMCVAACDAACGSMLQCVMTHVTSVKCLRHDVCCSARCSILHYVTLCCSHVVQLACLRHHVAAIQRI